MKIERRNGIEVIFNKSLDYICPMLGERLSEFVNLSGCFIGYKDYPEFDNNIFLLFKISENKIFKNFLDRMNYHQMFKVKINVCEDYEMFVFEVPKEYQTNYDNFRISQYSKLDDKYKRHILLFHNYSKYGVGNTVYKILYRDPSLYEAKEAQINEGLPENHWTLIPRDIEIGTALRENEEVFTIDIINELKTAIRD